MLKLMKTLMVASVFAVALGHQAKAADLGAPGPIAGPPGAAIPDDYYGPQHYGPGYSQDPGYSYDYYAPGNDRGYGPVPVPYSLSSPSYYDEDCRVIDEQTPYGWRRVRVCE